MPDETKTGAGQTSSEEEGRTSESKEGTTSDKAKTITLTQEELRKRESDAASKAGRTLKAENERLTSQLTETRSALQSSQTALDSTNSRLDEVERQMRESKLNRDDPASVSLFQERESLIAERRKHEREVREFQAEKQSVTEERKTVRAERIATLADKYGVDEDDLKALGEIPYEAVERYAKAVGKTKEKPKKTMASELKESGEEGSEDFEPDSSIGGGSGGGLDLDEEEQQKITPAELAKRMKAAKPDLLI